MQPDPEQSASARDGNRLFVQPQTYRRRRVMDTIRALPVLGMLLWAIPLLWSQGEAGPKTSSALIFVFVVWIVLVAFAALLIQRLQRVPDNPEGDGR